jgi:hypothetical protein
MVSQEADMIRRTTTLVVSIGVLSLSSLSAQTRTPWGDPDLQGTYTNTYEASTPFERPNEFAGRRLEDIKGEELAKMRLAIQQRTIGQFLGPEHAPDNWWQPNLNLDKGSQAWFVIDPPDGKIPPLTAEAQRRNQERVAARKASGRGPADSYTDRSLYDRCITRGLPGSMLPAIYGNQFEIVQAPGFVAIRYEMIHETRIIPLGSTPLTTRGSTALTTRGSTPLTTRGSTPLTTRASTALTTGSTTPVKIPQHMGSSRGRWEGDTLVIESSSFRDESAYRNANGATLKLTERFTRVAPDKVRWTVTVEDPLTWTRPWTFSLPLTADDNPVPSYECHEGNYGLKNILSAARAEENNR